MANTLTVNIPKILARTLPVLRENAVTPRLVNQTYSLNPQTKGSTITIPKSVALTAGSVSPSNTPPSVTDVTPGSSTITLDQWWDADFHLTDQEMTRIDAEGDFIPAQLSEAVKSLCNKVDDVLLGKYTGVYEYVGTAATTPFADAAALKAGWTGGAMVKLNTNLSPQSDRVVMMDPAAEGNALSLQNFQDSSWRGDAQGIINGQIGTKLGATWYMNQNIPSHTVGTLSNGTGMLAKVNDASYTVGESTVDIDETTLTGTVVVGDVFTVAGDTQTYTVTAGATAAANALAGMAFTPASKVAWDDDAVITFKAAHVANLAFHKNAFALAFAPLPIEDSETQSVITDPITGISLRLERVRQWKQTVWNLDVLFGCTLVRPELACRIAG